MNNINTLDYGSIIRFINDKIEYEIVRGKSILFVYFKNLTTGEIEQRPYGIAQMREMDLPIATVDGRRITRKKTKKQKNAPWIFD